MSTFGSDQETRCLRRWFSRPLNLGRVRASETSQGAHRVGGCPATSWTSSEGPSSTASAQSRSNLGVLKASDFTSSPQGGVYLGHEAKKRYFAAYESEIEAPFAADEGETSFRKLFRRQAERLARALQGGELYRAFRYPC